MIFPFVSFFRSRMAQTKKVQQKPKFKRYGSDMKVRGKLLSVYYNQVKGKPIIVLVHGLWGSIIQFREQIEYFNDKFSILALETVGHGDSEYLKSVQDYRMESIVDDYLDVFRQLDILDKKPVLVGHSYGALISRHLSTKLELSGIVFVAPLGFLDSSILRKTHKVLHGMPKWALKSILWVSNRKGEHSLGVNNSLGPEPTQLAREIQWFVTQKNYARFHTIVLSILGMVPAKVEEYENVKCPALVIGGQYDKTTPMNEHAKAIHECMKLPAENFKSYPVGHIIMAEIPDIVNKEIEAFMSQNCIFK